MTHLDETTLFRHTLDGSTKAAAEWHRRVRARQARREQMQNIRRKHRRKNKT